MNTATETEVQVRFDRNDLNYPNYNNLDLLMETETELSISLSEWCDVGMIFNKQGIDSRLPWIATGKVIIDGRKIPFAVYTVDYNEGGSFLVAPENSEDFDADMNTVLDALADKNCLRPSQIVRRSGHVTNRDVVMYLSHA